MAMTIQDYEDRINKANEKIEKLNKKIAKYEAKKSESAFIKDKLSWYTNDKSVIKNCLTLRDLSNFIYNSYASRYTEDELLHYYGTPQSHFEKISDDYDAWVKNCDNEIRHANEDIEATNNTILTYNNRIAFLQEQNAKPVIQIFKDFFNNWKKQILEWVNPLYQEYREIDKKGCDLHNRSYWYKQNLGEEEWRRLYQENNDRRKELRSSPMLMRRIENGEKGFDKWLDDYMNDRYNELVDKVTKYTGEITNVSDLHIGRDGTLNGVVEGQSGKARIETIGAGGYNVQCYHYRCLVHLIK